MSETSAPAVPTVAGMTISKKTEKLGQELVEVHVATFGTPARTISVVDLDMGAQFDLAEVTGGTDNLEYRNLAFIAASVTEIDGVPGLVTSAGYTKGRLREVLKRLGPDGVRAAGAVIQSFSGFGQASTEAEHKAAVGN